MAVFTQVIPSSRALLRGGIVGLGFSVVGAFQGPWLPVAEAASLGAYRFEGEVAERLMPSQVATGLQLSEFRYVGPDQPRWVSDLSGGFAYSAEDWSRRGASPDRYFELTAVPNDAFTLALESLSFDEKSDGNGPQAWEVRSSLDGYAAAIATVSPDRSSGFRRDQTVVLPDSFGQLNESVSFRFYGYNARRASGEWQLDNVRLTGQLRDRIAEMPQPPSLRQVPEGGTLWGYGLLGAALVAGHQRRRLGRPLCRLLQGDE